MNKEENPVILQVLPALESGGVERGTVQISQSLQASGFHSLVASSGGRMVHEIERAGGIHFDIPLNLKNPMHLVSNADRIATLINKFNVDIVHARSRGPAWSALSAVRRTGKYFVTTFHSTYGHNWLKHWYNAVMAKGDRVIAISEYVADHARNIYGLNEDRLITIPRGVNLDIFNPDAVTPERMIALSQQWQLPSDRPVVMLPGRLTRWKGQTIFLKALAQLNRQDIACVLVGDHQGRTKFRAELETLIKQYNLESIVWIVDHCQDMAAAYMLADVVISASTNPEGFGRIAVEGQAMGRPIIATDHGGARETVRSGETGWLVPPNDADSMCSAIDFALNLPPDDRSWVAEKARANAVEYYSADLMCKRTLNVYNSLLKGNT